jgi:segregation and condensation protein A
MPLTLANGSLKESQMEEAQEYKVKLENVFEGPMDLLIHLIKKNEVDIYDIPVGMITEQYLAYLEWMKLLNIDNVGDFLLMAATLAQIKSRMLLPTHEEDGEIEDPRMEIIRPLTEYLQIKSAAEELSRRNLLGDTIFVRRPNVKEYFQENQELVQVGLFELIDAFQKILQKAVKDHTVDLSTDSISVKDRMNAMIEILENKGSVAFQELFETGVDKHFFIVTFLALLELMKLNLVRAVQSPQSGIIRLFYQ